MKSTLKALPLEALFVFIERRECVKSLFDAFISIIPQP
jgi:hypothetical protein